MKDKRFLMIPGPTQVPESVLMTMAQHPMGHRSPEFSAVVKRVEENLKYVFQTKNDVHIYTASGTGAMDSAISNLVNKNDKVLCLIIGNFGARFAKIASSYGAIVEKIEVPYGQAIDPQVLRETLAKDVFKEIKVVTLTHNETSTGVTNPVKELVSIIKEHGAISVVDGITSISAIDCKMDEWGIDVLLSGSQKGFMVPPGLSFLAVNERAYEVHKNCEHPSFYFNWTAYKKNLEKDTTPYTPNVNLIMALDTALLMIKEEGLENVFKRHADNAQLLRKGLKELGLKLFVEDDSTASNAITSICPPDWCDVPAIRKTLKDEFDIIVANGQGELKDKIFRIGTLGFYTKRDILMTLACVKETLEILKLG